MPAPLHLRSAYSFRLGVNRPEEMVRRAAELGHRALALTDVNNLCAATMFDAAARQAGLAPIIGAELRIDGIALLGLAQSRTGYANLSRLITRIHCLDSPLYRDFADPGAVSALPEALSPLPECSQGVHWIVTQPDLARTLLELEMDPATLWLGIDPPTQRATDLRDLAELARTTPLRPVGLGRAMMTAPEDRATAQLLGAIGHGRTFENITDAQLPHPRALLRSERQIRDELQHWPEALENNRKLVEACSGFDLIPDQPVFPKTCPDPHQARARLESLCRQGLRDRYRQGLPAGAQARLQRELDLITRLGFCDYFLVVWDIVQFARRRQAPVAGRGSGASSLVAYLLGITNVCPLAYRIPFERFLHEQREDFPDLDVDFCWRIRDDVIDYAFRRWGRERTAMVSTHNCFQPRSAFREAAKALGVDDSTISRALRKGQASEPRLTRAAKLAPRLGKLPHLLSVHPGGIVITPGRIDEHVPLQPAAKDVLITQYDKDGVEDIRLVKLDLLGNRNLSTVREACGLIAEHRGICVDIEAIDEADPATLETLRSADTVGCNQLESPAMRHLLKMMRPSHTRDVMKILALIRPGAAGIGMKETFIQRIRGLAPVPPQPPEVADILQPTCGVMLYEDDVMLVAAAMLDCPLSEADRFRKAIQKCPTDARRLELSRQFLSRCKARGLDMDYAKDIWVQMAKYNAYSFCRAHAASYALLAYGGAYLKTHFPLEFWAACLNNNQSMYHPRVYVEQAKRDGVAFLLPDINRSKQEFAVEDGAIRIGLSRVEGLGPGGVEKILRRRREKPFEGITDFLLRTRLGEAETQSLILCGAFDGFGRNRPTQMMELKLFARIRPPRDMDGPAMFSVQPHIPNIPEDYDEARKYIDQRRVMGFTPGRHIMDWFRPVIAAETTATSRDLAGRVGQHVRLAGVLEARRTTPTTSGRSMLFLTLEDEWGLMEITAFPDLAQRCADQLGHYGPYLVAGRVEDQHDSISIRADDIRFLPGIWQRCQAG